MLRIVIQTPTRTWRSAIRRRLRSASDLGQTALVAVVTVAVIGTMIGFILVSTVVQSYPLQQQQAVGVYANRALEAGINAYVTAVNTNPSLAQCNSSTNNTGLCSGLSYGTWNPVPDSNSAGADAEYYAFGNPKPTFASQTTNALTSLSVQVVGAAKDQGTTNGYLFDQETMTLTPSNGFLNNVWWTNYESYSPNGDYSTCNYNWKLNYKIDNANVDCSPVYFGPADYLFGPVYTNDSVFVSGDGTPANSPSFGTTNAPSPVITADPHCQFVDDADGMSGSDANCGQANNEVALYDTVNSKYGNSVETPPSSDSQLGVIASEYGCLYSGPTQITLSTTTGGTGQMTVVSPDTSESTVTSNGNNYTWDNSNNSTNLNNCPNNGTAPLPPDGVVFVQNAPSSQTVAWANPLDGPVWNSVTNLTASPTPSAGHATTLTATVTSASNQIDNGATVAFSQTTTNFGRTQTAVINSCSAVSLSAPTAVIPATNPATYTSTATCATTESTSGTGAFSAAYSGGNYTGASSANLGQTYTLTPTESYGPYSQVTAGGCSSCYYGETSSPDSEGDAFVNGALSGQLTIGTANDLIVDGNISYNDCQFNNLGYGGSTYCPYNDSGTNDSLGLIAENYAEVGRPLQASGSGGNNPTIAPYCAGTPSATCDPSNGSNGISIDAAVLALNQSFVVNNYGDGGSEGDLDVYGSIQQFARGPVGTFNNGAIVTGYSKHYTWDPLLDFVSPPSYLAPSTASWVLQGVSVNAGLSGTNVCPPLDAPYGSAGNTYLTQYCASSSPGGLSGYPTSTAPTPPTIGPATVNTSNGAVTLNWTDPAYNGGSPITGYSVETYPNCPSCTGTSVSSATAISTTMTGFTPGTSYTFAVSATNGVGSDGSGRSNSVTIPTVPSPPTNVAAAVNANGTVTVSWTDPTNSGSPVTSYSVVPSPTCPACTGTAVSSGTATSTIVGGLTSGTTYSFTVTATNGIGTSNASTASNSVTAPTVPGAPTIGTATAGAATATLTWTAPANTGGSAITGYVVTPYVAGVAQTPQTFTSTATSESVTNLTNGTAYTFKVAATNGVGTGNQSAASNSVTPATVPGAPTGVSATASGTTNAATVTWTAPSSNGGSAITGYVVTPYRNGTIAQTPQTFSSTATSESVTGLTQFDSYTFKVAAINAAGTGSQSTASGSVTINH